jgi:hypothetical protein
MFFNTYGTQKDDKQLVGYFCSRVRDIVDGLRPTLVVQGVPDRDMVQGDQVRSARTRDWQLQKVSDFNLQFGFY